MKKQKSKKRLDKNISKGRHILDHLLFYDYSGGKYLDKDSKKLIENHKPSYRDEEEHELLGNPENVKVGGKDLKDMIDTLESLAGKLKKLI